MPAIPADLDADAVAAAVRACPGVSAISTVTGPGTAPADADPHDAGLGPLAISYDHDAIDISVIAFYGQPLAAVVEQIEQAIRPLIGHRHLTVSVDDLDTHQGPREAWDPPDPHEPG